MKISFAAVVSCPVMSHRPTSPWTISPVDKISPHTQTHTHRDAHTRSSRFFSLFLYLLKFSQIIWEFSSAASARAEQQQRSNRGAAAAVSGSRIAEQVRVKGKCVCAHLASDLRHAIDSSIFDEFLIALATLCCLSMSASVCVYMCVCVENVCKAAKAEEKVKFKAVAQHRLRLQLRLAAWQEGRGQRLEKSWRSNVFVIKILPRYHPLPFAISPPSLFLFVCFALLSCSTPSGARSVILRFVLTDLSKALRRNLAQTGHQSWKHTHTHTQWHSK